MPQTKPLATGKLPAPVLPSLERNQETRAFTWNGVDTRRSSFRRVASTLGLGRNESGHNEGVRSDVSRGEVVLNYPALRLTADPVRPRVYATVRSSNSVIVIDTATLAVTKSIVVGSSPRGLAVSADRSKLWVALAEGPNPGVGVVDLETLSALPPIPAPSPAADVEEGLGQRLYVASAGGGGGIMQINAASGAYEGRIPGSSTSNGFLEIAPDRKTLFYGNEGISPSTFSKYDVSSAVGKELQRAQLGSNGYNLAIGRAGDLIVYPNVYTTLEVPTRDITSINGTFVLRVYGGPAVFSNDETLLYATDTNPLRAAIYDTCSYLPITAIPILGTSTLNDIVVDRSGRWLFVATGSNENGTLRIYNTGRDDPVKPLPKKVVSRKLHGAAGTFDIELSTRCTPATEPRVEPTGGTHRLVFAFSAPVTVGGASVTTAEGKTAEVDGPLLFSSDNTEVTVNLKNVSDVQTLKVALLAVNDGSASGSGDVTATMRLLAGDTTGEAAVSSRDARQTRERTPQSASAMNFRNDVNTDGVVNTGDVLLVESHSGNSLEP